MQYGSKLISKDTILEKVNEFDIFKYYIPSFKTLGVPFKSNLRQDKTPTCKIGAREGKLWYRDFSEPTSYNCFDYVARAYNVSFHQALEIIKRDFNLNLISTTFLGQYEKKDTAPTLTEFDISEAEKLPTEIKIKTRDWSYADKYFWFKKYEIKVEDLEHFNVFPISHYWVNDVLTICGNQSYAYYFGKYEDGRSIIKIYQPYSKIKWLSNCTIDVFQGYNQLPESGKTLIITKSLKDVIVLYKLGYSAIAPHGESYRIETSFMQSLRERFDKIVILYDNDNAGKKCAEELSKDHSLETIFFPEDTKDASDFVEERNYEELKSYLEKNGI